MLVPAQLTYSSHLWLGTFIGLSLLCRHVNVQRLIFFTVKKPCKCFWEWHFLVACSAMSLFPLFSRNPAWSIHCLWLQSWFKSSRLPHIRLLVPITEQRVTAPSAGLKQLLHPWNNPRLFLKPLAKSIGIFLVCLLFWAFINPVWWLAQLHRIKPAQLRKWSIIAMGQE